MIRWFTIFFSLFFCSVWVLAEQKNSYPPIPEFSLIDQHGKEFSLQNLRGRVTIVNFIFTRCQGPCPLLSQKMAQLQKTLPKEVALLSISVDPDYDSAQVLEEYAQSFQAQDGRWAFLSGEKQAVYDLILKGFLQPVQQNETQRVSDQFIHSTRFVLLNDAKISGFYNFEDKVDMKRLPKDALLAHRRAEYPRVAKLPHLNAILNSLCALILLWGFLSIKVSAKSLHRIMMSVAFCLSIAFLISYLVYHHYMGSVAYSGQGIMRTYYFAVLISHTILAAFVPFLALRTFYLALKERIDQHRVWARWTFPIWMYVSVTGVIIYWMLYRA